MGQWVRITRLTKKDPNDRRTRGEIVAINKNSIGTINTPFGRFTYNKHLQSSVNIDIEKEMNPNLKKVIYIRRR